MYREGTLGAMSPAIARISRAVANAQAKVAVSGARPLATPSLRLPSLPIRRASTPAAPEPLASPAVVPIAAGPPPPSLPAPAGPVSVFAQPFDDGPAPSIAPSDGASASQPAGARGAGLLPLLLIGVAGFWLFSRRSRRRGG